MLNFWIVCLKLRLNVNFCFVEQDGEGILKTLKKYEEKIQQLEKDLYFYKKTSRDLKKKMIETARGASPWQLSLADRKAFSVTCHLNPLPSHTSA